MYLFIYLSIYLFIYLFVYFQCILYRLTKQYELLLLLNKYRLENVKTRRSEIMLFYIFY